MINYTYSIYFVYVCVRIYVCVYIQLCTYTAFILLLQGTFFIITVRAHYVLVLFPKYRLERKYSFNIATPWHPKVSDTRI